MWGCVSLAKARASRAKRSANPGSWLTLALVLALVHFFLPFFALVSRDAKGDPRRLRWVAVVVLVSHALDVYWMTFPVLGRGALPGWTELSFALLFGGGALLWVRRSMALGADMPVGDPFLREGLEFKL